MVQLAAVSHTIFLLLLLLAGFFVQEVAGLVRLVEEARRDAAAAAGEEGRSELKERIKAIAEREVFFVGVFVSHRRTCCGDECSF